MSADHKVKYWADKEARLAAQQERARVRASDARPRHWRSVQIGESRREFRDRLLGIVPKLIERTRPT